MKIVWSKKWRCPKCGNTYVHDGYYPHNQACNNEYCYRELGNMRVGMYCMSCKKGAYACKCIPLAWIKGWAGKKTYPFRRKLAGLLGFKTYY